MDFLNQILEIELVREILTAVLGSVAVATFFDDFLAGVAKRWLPGWLGNVVAIVIRRLSLWSRNWIESQVKASAERAVREADALAPDAPGVEKGVIARAELDRAEPGLSTLQIDREVETAFERLQTDAQRTAAKVVAQ